MAFIIIMHRTFDDLCAMYISSFKALENILLVPLIENEILHSNTLGVML